MVDITVIGGNKESDEYRAALKLKEIILRGLPKDVLGEIVIYASATLIGQEVKDIDLFLIGMLNNYKPKLFFNVEKDDDIVETNSEVYIESFCTTIEVKSHSITGIERQGTDFYVKYGSSNHCVTEQSNRQKISAKSFFERMLNYSPFITNLIWFTEATKGEIDSLLRVNGKRMSSNVLGADFEFKELAQLLVWQKKPKKKNGERYLFDSYMFNLNDFRNVLNTFTRTKKGMGELTRKRIEQITNENFKKNRLLNDEASISIYRGRAGTGKTVGLIQTAIELVDEKQSRVLILTYNKALVSDIRRLFALAELPDMFEEKCVHISTMQSYFFKVINLVLYDGLLNGEDYLQNYEEYLEELCDFLQDEGTKLEMKAQINNIIELNWNYVLIDEAQDWTEIEKNIIIKLFNVGKIIVADGGQQFVRDIEACDWSSIRERKNIKLKYCLRQKNNVVKFINQYIIETGGYSSKIISNNELVGGKVLIIANDTLLFDVIKDEKNNLKKSGNIEYDFLFFTTSQRVEKCDDDHYFRDKSLFEKNDIFVWDGTCERNRETYPVRNDECRVLQYESSRGLEGWTVCCLDYDQYIDNKINQYVPKETNSLILESDEDKKGKYVTNWALLPLTRAIDTLIISLKDKKSQTALVLKKIAEEHSDYIQWIE